MKPGWFVNTVENLLLQKEKIPNGVQQNAVAEEEIELITIEAKNEFVPIEKQRVSHDEKRLCSLAVNTVQNKTIFLLIFL